MSEKHPLPDRISWYPLAAGVVLVVLLAAGREVLYPVRALFWHSKAVVWWLAILAGALGQGSFLFKRLAGDRLGLPPGLVFSLTTGLGLGMFSMEVFILGAFGLMNTPVFTLLVLVMVAFTLIAERTAITGILAGAVGDINGRAREATLPLAAALTTAMVVFPLVLVPNRAFDALSYHLEVPLRYLQAGAIINIPENMYSYSPLLTQMLYGLGLGLHGPDLAGLLYYTFFILSIWTLWKGGEELFGGAGSAWAAVLMALTPVFLVEVPQAGADWSMTFFVVTALLLLAGGGRETNRMLLAAILAGMAAGCRHQALGYSLVLIPAAGLMIDFTAKRSGTIRAWSIFTAAGFASACPWYIKNLIQTGDPLYPLITSLTGGLGYDIGFVDSLVGSKPVHLLWSWILVPFQSALDPLSLSMTATVGILPLALALLLPGLKGKRTGNGFLLLWIILAFFAWHLTFRTFRYSMPVMAIGYLWLGAGLARALEGSRGTGRVLRYAVCLALAINGGTFLGLTDYVNRSVAPALGIMSPERYIQETYGTYPAIDHLNSLVQPPGRVLFVGEMRGFYSNFPREVPSHNAPNRLFEIIKEDREPEYIKDVLVKAGFTHLLFNPGEWERMAYNNRSAPLWILSDAHKTALYAFLREYTRLLFTSNGVSVHGIILE